MKTGDTHGPEHIRSLPMNATDSIEFNFIEFVNFLFSRRRSFLIVSFTLSIGILIYLAAVEEPRYQSNGIVSINIGSKSESFSLSRFTNWAEEQEILTKVYMIEQFFESPMFRRAMIAEVEHKTSYCPGSACKELKNELQRQFARKEAFTDEDKIDLILNIVSTRSDDQRHTLTITSTASDPKVAQAVTTIAIHTLVALNYEHLLSKNSRVREFLETQTKATEVKLAELEEQLMQEQIAHNVIATGETENRLTSIYLENRQRVHTLVRDKLALVLLEQEIKDQIKGFKKKITAPDAMSHIYLSQLQRRFEVLKYQQAVKTKESRELASQPTEADFENFKKAMDSDNQTFIATDPWEYIKKSEEFLIQVRQQRDKLTGEIQAAEKSMDQWEEQNADMPQVLRRLSSIKRNIDVLATIYSSLKTRVQETSINESERANDLAVLSVPDSPGDAVGLSFRKKAALGVASGPGATTLFMLLMYILIPLARQSDLEAMGVSVLARVTRYRKPGRWLRHNDLLNKRTYDQVLCLEPESYHANCMRYLRFRLEREMHDRVPEDRGRIVTFTSYNTGEGKTFTVVNLATAMAFSGMNVLLVDLDFRGSDMSFYFSDPEEVLEIETEYKNLGLTLTKYSSRIHVLKIRSVALDIQDYLQSKDFRDIFERLRASYNYLLVDTAPLDGNVEAYMVSSYSDATVFVVNQRTTLREHIIQGISNLKQLNSKPVFAIINYSLEGIKFFRFGKKTTKH